MRRKLKKLTSVCLAVIMLLSVMTVAPITVNAADEINESVGDTYTSGDFEYELYDDTVYIIRYSGNETNLTIPSEIDGYIVTEIGGGAFCGNTSLKNVTIPDSVSYIGGYAFGYIYNYDIWDYEKVDGFTIYGYTNSEADLYAIKNGFTFVSLGTVAPFSYDVLEDGTAAITEYRGIETDLTIPSEIDGNTVTNIGNNAFAYNATLTSLTIPDSVTSIGNIAFYGCSNLSIIKIPDSVTNIGANAFYDTAWYNNQSDGVIYINNILYDYKGEMPENTIINIKEGTKCIADCALSRNFNLNGVTIPDSVISIGNSAFAGSFSLKDIVIPDSVINIGVSAFEDCVSMNSVVVSNSVTIINDFTFSNCQSLTKATIPNSVRSIGCAAFSDCLSLTKVTIPNSVTTISEAAFKGCSNLTEVTIPNSVKTIGNVAFKGCSNLSSLTISNGVIEIEYSAFENCRNLESVTIPNSVKKIDLCAFGYSEHRYEYDAGDGIEYEYISEPIRGFTIYGYTNTAAETYANKNGFAFVELGDVPTPSLGDVNGDGKISIDDVTDIQKYLVTMVDFTNEQVSLADVDKDGKVSIDDVTLIQKYLAGIATI